MKTLKILTVLTFALFFASCSDDDDNNGNQEIVLTESEIPTIIMEYKTTHFPDNDIIRATMDTEANVVTYELDLEGFFEMDFNAEYEIIDIDGTTQLPDSVIPQALLDYVNENYPNNFITDWELELNHQQIELNNDLDLEFDMDGAFIRIDHD